MILVLLLACGPKKGADADPALSPTRGGDTVVEGGDNVLSGCAAIMTFDAMQDGTTDWLWYFYYDDLGNIDFVDSDAQANGTLDAVMDYVYVDGLLDQRRWDDRRDGVINSAEIYSYDADRQLISEVSDSGADGVADEILTWTWIDGLAVYEDADWEADGVVDERITWSYVDGLKTHGEHDDGLDGTVDGYQDLVYEAGLVVERTSDAGADGTVDVRERTTYDTSGRKLTEAKDMGDDGQIDAWSSYAYDCP